MGRTFTIIMITNNNPLDVMAMVVCGGLRDPFPFTSDSALNLACSTIPNVDSTNCQRAIFMVSNFDF